MGRFRRVIGGFNALFRKQRVDRELDEELRAYLETSIEERMRAGMTPKDAIRAARVEMGSLEAVKDRTRDVGWEAGLESVWQDVRYALRTLRRSPGFAAVAILTLALGIGANTAIFSVANAVLLRPLPYRNPGSLVLIEPTPIVLSPAWVTSAWRERARSLSDFAGFNGPRAATLVDRGEPEQVDSADVTWNFFSFLGVPLAVGRDFTEADASPGAPAVAVLSHDLWMRRFGGDRGVLGRTVTLSGESVTVVGFTDRAFRFPTGGALPTSGVSIDTQPDVIRVASASRPHNVIGRLAPGATPASAAAELLAIFKQEGESRFRRTLLDRMELGVAPLQQRLVGNVRQRLWLVMGAVGFVLLVACANVANLLLARASARQREFAVRTALGARRSRLARLVLSESVLLALIGSAGALLVTFWTSGVARTMLADRIPHVEAIVIDWWVLGFNAAVAAVTGILCGLASLPGVTRVNLAATFSDARAPAATGRTTIRRALLAIEVAVTFVLVVGAALLAQTVWNLNLKERGFDADRLLTVRVSPGLPLGSDRSQVRTGQMFFAAFFTDLTQRVGRLPAVVSAAAVSTVPLAGTGVAMTNVAVEGQPPPPPDASSAPVASVTPGYFRTMRIALVAGRDFDEGDRLGSERVAIVNEAFRRRFAPSGNIVGSRFSFGDAFITVIGVAEDVPDRSLREVAQPLVFTPLPQMAAAPFGWGQFTLVLRTQDGDPHSIAPAVRREIWAVDRNIVINDIATMDERVAASVRSERQSALLFGLFAVAALVIAAIGVYGVAAYAIAQRTREIGIRVALGAARRDVTMLVIVQTLAPTLAGVAVGVVVAFVMTRVVASMLYGVTPLDPATFAGAALVLVSLALAASYLPARRAMTIDPVVALRYE